MIQWVHIENGAIESYHEYLPANWGNVSGLNLSETNLTFLKSIGWLPVTTIVPSYDPELKQIKEYKYKIRTSDVTATAVLEDIPAPSPQDILVDFFTMLRQERHIRLLESDWTQLSDVQQIKDTEWKTKWGNYRQSLRDITKVYSTPVLFSDIVWPIPPDN